MVIMEPPGPLITRTDPGVPAKLNYSNLNVTIGITTGSKYHILLFGQCKNTKRAQTHEITIKIGKPGFDLWTDA